MGWNVTWQVKGKWKINVPYADELYQDCIHILLCCTDTVRVCAVWDERELWQHLHLQSQLLLL